MSGVGLQILAAIGVVGALVCLCIAAAVDPDDFRKRDVEESEERKAKRVAE